MQETAALGILFKFSTGPAHASHGIQSNPQTESHAHKVRHPAILAQYLWIRISNSKKTHLGQNP